MARKKVNPEPQEEPMENTDAAMEDMAGEDAGPAPDTPTGGDDPALLSAGDGSEDAAPDSYPAADELPFEEAPESSAATGPDTDDAFQNGGDTESGPPMEDKDYDAFLQAVGNGDVEPVAPPESAPLLLDEAEGYDAGDDPPASEENISGNEGVPTPARVEDRRSAPRLERERVLTIDPHAQV